MKCRMGLIFIVLAACVAIARLDAAWADSAAAVKKPKEAKEASSTKEGKESKQTKRSKAKKGTDEREEAKLAETKETKSDKETQKGKEAKKAAAEAEPAKSEKPADSGKEAKPATPPKPSLYTVKKGPLKVELTLEGTFEAQQMSEIVLRPHEWSGFTVLRAVEHGTPVKVGDLLIALDTEKIDRAIADLRADLQTSEISLQQAEQDLRALEATTKIDLAAAERLHRVAEEDYQYFVDVTRPLDLKTVEFALKLAQIQLDYAKEEYEQLEKMYKADDITEETETIVLKRGKNQVETAQFLYDRTKIQHDRAVKHDLPRDEERMKESLKRANVVWEKARAVLPLALRKQQLEMEKAKVLRRRSEDRLTKLLEDRESMTIKSPTDGIAYYGSCDRGRWSSMGMADDLRKGGSVPPHKIVMTVVRTRPMLIRVNVPERQLANVHAGQQASVKPTGYTDLKLTAILERVGAVPLTGGNYDGRLTVALDQRDEALMPGMTCEVKIVAYENKEALAVPTAAVATDEKDDEKHYVYQPDKDGKPQKRPVKIGKRTDKQIEILEGLKEGDEILAEAPKEAKESKDKK